MGILEQVLRRNGRAGHSLKDEHEMVNGERMEAVQIGRILGFGLICQWDGREDAWLYCGLPK